MCVCILQARCGSWHVLAGNAHVAQVLVLLALLTTTVLLLLTSTALDTWYYLLLYYWLLTTGATRGALPVLLRAARLGGSALGDCSAVCDCPRLAVGNRARSLTMLHDAGMMLERCCWNDAGTRTMLGRCWNDAGTRLEWCWNHAG